MLFAISGAPCSQKPDLNKNFKFKSSKFRKFCEESFHNWNIQDAFYGWFICIKKYKKKLADTSSAFIQALYIFARKEILLSYENDQQTRPKSLIRWNDPWVWITSLPTRVTHKFDQQVWPTSLTARMTHKFTHKNDPWFWCTSLTHEK